MRYKESIKLIKEALKHHWMYTEEELTYMRKQLRMTKELLKKKKSFKNVCNEGKSSNSNS
jgi:hypothetical protein